MGYEIQLFKHSFAICLSSLPEWRPCENWDLVHTAYAQPWKCNQGSLNICCINNCVYNRYDQQSHKMELQIKQRGASLLPPSRCYFTLCINSAMATPKSFNNIFSSFWGPLQNFPQHLLSSPTSNQSAPTILTIICKRTVTFQTWPLLGFMSSPAVCSTFSKSMSNHFNPAGQTSSVP